MKIPVEWHILQIYSGHDYTKKVAPKRFNFEVPLEILDINHGDI